MIGGQPLPSGFIIVVNAERGGASSLNGKKELAPVPKLVVKVIQILFADERIIQFYLRWISLVNYAMVCGIGVGINMYVLLGLAKILPLWLANLCAIGTAFLWNWSMSVGPMGWIWGLSERPSRRKNVSVSFRNTPRGTARRIPIDFGEKRDKNKKEASEE